MAGTDETYAHAPYFHTNVFDFGTRRWHPGLDSSHRRGLAEAIDRRAVCYLAEDRRVQGDLVHRLASED